MGYIGITGGQLPLINKKKDVEFSVLVIYGIFLFWIIKKSIHYVNTTLYTFH